MSQEEIMKENKQILQEIAEIETDESLDREETEFYEDYFERFKEGASDPRYNVDYVAKLIITGENELAFQLLEHGFDKFDTRSSNDCFTTNGHSLIELAVRANNKEAVEYLFTNCTDASEISCNEVIGSFLKVQPLYLAIKLGHNEIAKYLYDCESQLAFPGDDTSVQAINHAIYYKNEDLIEYFIVMFSYYQDNIVKLLLEKN